MFPHLVSFSRRKPDSRLPRWTSVLAGDGISGTSNLRMYLSLAVLPPMQLGRTRDVPAEGHKTHQNTLSVRAEDWRKLTEMTTIPDTEFVSRVLQFIHKYIPSHDLRVSDLDQEIGGCLSVPCMPFSTVDVTGTFVRPYTMTQLLRWVTDLPLMTVQRVLHLVFPHTQEWSFSAVMADPDDDIVSCVTWDRRNPDRSVDSAMAVMVQPPWIASAADLDSFVKCKRLPRVNPHLSDVDNNKGYCSKERMWAKIWDFCARRGCHYFIVTTYWGWVFGAFSRGRSKGFVTSLKMYDASSPTILEFLTFWFASAMQISGGWNIPEVAEAVFDVNLGVPDMPNPYCLTRLPSPTPSESTWQANDYEDTDPTSLAEVEEVSELLLSPDILNNTPLLPPTNGEVSRLLQENLVNWQQNGAFFHVNDLPPSAFQAPSEVSTAITVSSAASACIDEIQTSGDWLTERRTDAGYCLQVAA